MSKSLKKVKKGRKTKEFKRFLEQFLVIFALPL
jgi:hypothetical protein